MKRAICLVLVLMVCLTPCVIAEEITFRGIPWGSSVDDALAHFEEIGFVGVDLVWTEEAGLEWFRDGKMVTAEDEYDMHRLIECRESSLDRFGDLVLGYFPLLGECGYECKTVLSCELEVAEHDVSSFTMQFLYGVNEDEVSRMRTDAELCSAKYEFSASDYAAAYDDLLDKMTWLYGEPLETKSEGKKTDDKHERYALWHGDNDTAALLYVKYYTDDTPTLRSKLSIEYCKVDYEERAEAVIKYLEQEERGLKYNSENTDGL